MSDFYQQIGRAVMSFAQNPEGKLLLYSEVESGVVSADVFFQERIGSPVQFRFAPKALADLIYNFWETGEDKIGPRSWAVFQLAIEKGQFTVRLEYPDKLVANEDVSDRRPRVLDEHYPNAKIDYSHPSG